MHIRTVLMSAAVAGVLAAGGTAQAQLLGGGAGGSLGGSLTGGLGHVGGQAGGTLDGSVRGTTDALGRTRDPGSRTTGRVKDQADDTANTVPAKADRAPAGKPQPQPQAHAGGKASGNNSLSAADGQPALAQGNAGAEVNASIEK